MIELDSGDRDLLADVSFAAAVNMARALEQSK